MKKLIAFYIVFICYAHISVLAQTTMHQDYDTGKPTVIDAQNDQFKNADSKHIIIQNLQVNDFDDISILDKSGTILFKKSVSGAETTINVSQLKSGVYILRLWSSKQMNEKTIKVFIGV
ncbi:MAG: T9SS type A sorting domain-containing protein [Chitinophagaceae bacterium]